MLILDSSDLTFYLLNHLISFILLLFVLHLEQLHLLLHQLDILLIDSVLLYLLFLKTIHFMLQVVDGLMDLSQFILHRFLLYSVLGNLFHGLFVLFVGLHKLLLQLGVFILKFEPLLIKLLRLAFLGLLLLVREVA